MSSLDHTIRTSPVRVVPGRFAVVQARRVPPASPHFMVAHDADETTVITDERNLHLLDVSESRGGFTLLEIQVSTPFGTPGFLATVSRILADAGLNVLIVSTFSKDYLLLEAETADEGLRALTLAGFVIEGG